MHGGGKVAAGGPSSAHPSCSRSSTSRWSRWCRSSCSAWRWRGSTSAPATCSRRSRCTRPSTGSRSPSRCSSNTTWCVSPSELSRMKNWAGNHQYQARRLHRPGSLDEVQELVRGAARIRALGSRHSFNDLADTRGDLLTLAGLPRVLEIDPTTRSVTVDGALRYGELCGPLHEAGFALDAMASLPHISVAGACATATHGSGDRSRVLPAAVSAIEMVRADGEMVRLSRADDRETFDGAVVGLGALGIVTRLTLAIEPTFQMRQDVYEHLPVDAFAADFDDITASAQSVSFFTDWREPVFDQVWLKRRVAETDGGGLAADFHGAVPATRELHPIRALSPAACTPQLGVPGPWHERLPHFRMDHTPSSGDELQSEYVIGRENAVEAFAALDRMRDRIA